IGGLQAYRRIIGPSGFAQTPQDLEKATQTPVGFCLPGLRGNGLAKVSFDGGIVSKLIVDRRQSDLSVRLLGGNLHHGMEEMKGFAQLSAALKHQREIELGGNESRSFSRRRSKATLGQFQFVGLQMPKPLLELVLMIHYPGFDSCAWKRVCPTRAIRSR